MKAGAAVAVRGIAFGGDTGVKPWISPPTAARAGSAAQLGKDEGKYSFRQWHTTFTPAAKGDATLMVRCTNSKRRGAAGGAELESVRLHAQRD